MTIYVFLNWMFCLGTTLLLGLILWRYRFLILKPSIVVLFFFHIQIQWAATFQAEYIEMYLPHPYPFFFLAQVFPLLGLMVSFFFLHKLTRSIYKKLYKTTLWELELKPRSMWMLLAGVLVIVILYLRVTPLSRTGIYAILLDPLQAAAARESSLKLVNSGLIRYSFSLLKASLAPVLSVLAAVYFLQNLRDKRFDRSAVGMAIFLFTLLAVMLPGARTPGGILILTIILALFVIYGLPIRPLYLFISFFLIVGLPVLMTIFREGQEVNALVFFEYLQGGIFNRLFVVPMETGLWHTHYAQTTGFVGVTGIPKLAQFFGVAPINLGNIIYLKYSLYNHASGLSNTCFVFAYYSCFGIISLVFSLFALWSLDLAMLVLTRLRNNAILLATVAALGTSSFWFAATMFTTALITNGFLFILLLAFILDRLSYYSFNIPFFHKKRGMEK